jgi:hypothetical protein
VTGQAGWYDVRVRIYPADAGEEKISSPQFETMPVLPGQRIDRKPSRWLTYFAGRGGRS